MWFRGRYWIHTKPGKSLAKENAHKYTNYDQHLYLLSYTHMQTHTSTHTPAIELRLVCAEHSTVTLAQHIKEPPLTPSSRASCAPPACIPRASRRGSVCFITFVLILQSVSNSGRKCWALSLLLYSMNVLLKCRETRRSSTERRRHHHLCCVDRTTPTALTLNWLWKGQLALYVRYKPIFHYQGSHNSIPEAPARQAAYVRRSQAWNWIFTNELYPIRGSQTIQSMTECN